MGTIAAGRDQREGPASMVDAHRSVRTCRFPRCTRQASAQRPLMAAARHMAADAQCGSGAEQASVTSEGTTMASSSGGMPAASARHCSAATISCNARPLLSHLARH